MPIEGWNIPREPFRHIREEWTDPDGAWIRTKDGELAGPFADSREAREAFAPCPTCNGYGGVSFDQTGGMAQTCPDCDETGLKNP